MDVTQTLHELDLNMNFATTDQPLVGQIKNTKKTLLLGILLTKTLFCY